MPPITDDYDFSVIFESLPPGNWLLLPLATLTVLSVVCFFTYFKVLHWSIIYITMHALRCAFQWVLLNVYTHVTTSQIKIQDVPITLGVLSCILSVSYLFNWSPAAAAAKLHQSCLTLCNPIGSSPPGSPVPGILQARTLEWVAISFSNAWKWKWSHSVMSDSSQPHGL